MPEVSMEEKKISFLNNYFVFTKIADSGQLLS